MNAARLVALGAAAVLAVAAPCQLSYTSFAAPSIWPAYYDDQRDVLVCWGINGMWEYDGMTWTLLPAAGMPSFPSVSVAFDSARARFVAIDLGSATTWEWDGAAWWSLGPAPIVPLGSSLPNSYNFQVAYHATRQRVMLFSDGGASRLKEWDGSTWLSVPATGSSLPPPTWALPNVQSYTYGTLAYDARRDLLVLFGRGGPYPSPNAQSLPITWEWDAVNGWIQQPTTGPSVGAMWFDSHRGTLIHGEIGLPTNRFCVWDDVSGWTLLQTTTFPLLAPLCYDARRNRMFYGTSTGLGIVSDTFPASFEPHAQGCTPPSAWPLQLTAPWRRAWTGGTLSVDVIAPFSTAVLAMGFTDQAYGSSPLPIPLGPYGLTACSLRVAPEATVVGTTSASLAVTFPIPVPAFAGLLGTHYWQQAFALAPGANPANLIASDSIHGTIGRFR